MGSIMTAVFVLASLQYALADLMSGCVLALINTKPDIDPIDARNEGRYIAHHYRGG